MAKRFLDTSIWERPWFMDLDPPDKMAVMYLFAKCDAVGVWVPNYKLADFQMHATVDWEALPDKCNGNIRVLDNGKWWVVDFCKFQYGDLNGGCRPHASYLKLLKEHGLEGYVKGMDTLKEKEKELDKEKDKDKEERAPGVLLTTSEHDKLVAKYGVDATTAAYAKLSAAKLAKGYKYKSDYGAILNWVMGEVQKTGKYPKPSSVPKVSAPACPKCGQPTMDYDEHSWACHGCKRFFDKATMAEENIVPMEFKA